jgi:hypothetical protein
MIFHKKKYSMMGLVLFQLFCCLRTYSQYRNDYWYSALQPGQTNYLGGNRLSNWQPLAFQIDTNIQYYGRQCSVLSPQDESWRIYFNGNQVVNKQFDTLTGGGDINPLFGSGYPFPFPLLPYPGKADSVILFFHGYSCNSVIACYAPELSVAIIKPLANNGAGMVLSIDTLINTLDTLNSGSIAVVRHANGRDWWVFAQRRWGEHWFKILLSPDAPIVAEPFVLEGDSGFVNTVNSPKFSPSGELFTFISNPTHPSTGVSFAHTLRLFDFDRCTGTFSNPRSKLLVQNGDVNYQDYYSTVCFSKSGRYLYCSSQYRLKQFDLINGDLNTSRVVGDAQPLVCPYNPSLFSNLGYPFVSEQGEMFITSGNIYMHRVIDHDEINGQAVLENNFMQTPAYVRGLPSNAHVNLKLGAADGSLCDSLGLNAIKPNEPIATRDFYAQPNPAGQWLAFTVGEISGLSDKSVILISSAQAQAINEIKLDRGKGQYLLDTRAMSNGIYFYKVLGSKENIRGKFVVQHE